MKIIALAAVTAALGFAGATQAATTVEFTPGGAAPAAGQTVVYDFDTTVPASLIPSTQVQIKSPPTDTDGAPPANSMPSGTNYLSVLQGGIALILFDGPVTAFSFDWGSLDTYNTLTILPLNESSIVIPGTTFTNTPANGDQVSPGTNGLLTVTGTLGTQYLGFTLTSTANSFEIDNVSIAGGIGGDVPEPATWALSVLGFGAIGFAMRRRNVTTRLTYAG